MTDDLLSLENEEMSPMPPIIHNKEDTKTLAMQSRLVTATNISDITRMNEPRTLYGSQTTTRNNNRHIRTNQNFTRAMVSTS